MSRSWMQSIGSMLPSPFSTPTSRGGGGAEGGRHGEISVGHRVSLDECLDPVLLVEKRALWRADKSERLGCLLHTEHSHDTELYWVVGLDRPINTSPTPAETVASAVYLCVNQFDVPAQHIVCIPASLVHKGRVVVREVSYDFHGLGERCVVKCQLDECGRGTTKRRMLYTCHQWRHMLCMEHIIPWDHQFDRPDLESCVIYHEQMLDYSTQVLPRPKSGFETRVLLGFNYWIEGAAGGEDDQATAVQEFARFDQWVCKLCKDSKHNREWANSSFADIHNQLFPHGVVGSLCMEGASQLLSSRAPDVLSALLARGYSRADIDTTLSVEDVPSARSDIDADLLCAMIESAKASGAPKLEANITSSVRFTQAHRCLEALPLTLFCPETQARRLVHTEAGMDLESLCARVYEALPHYSDRDNVLLHRLDGDGWGVELVNATGGTSGAHVCGVDALRRDDVVTVRRRQNVGVMNIGARYRQFSALSIHPTGTVDASLLATIAYLQSRHYAGFRRVRGDGNCYYRAAIFGLLEQMARRRRFDRFLVLHGLLAPIRYPADAAAADGHDRLLAFLLNCARAEPDCPVLALDIEGAFIECPDIDRAAIRACRSLVSAYLRRHADTPLPNGLTIWAFIQPFYEQDRDVRDMDTYCTKFVDRMETDVEYIVELGVLPFLLRCASWTTEDTENGNHEVAHFCLPDSSLDAASSAVAPWGSLHLLLRPGHYELLYPEGTEFDAVLPCRAEGERDRRPAQIVPHGPGEGRREGRGESKGESKAEGKEGREDTKASLSAATSSSSSSPRVFTRPRGSSTSSESSSGPSPRAESKAAHAPGGAGPRAEGTSQDRMTPDSLDGGGRRDRGERGGRKGL